MPPAPLLPLRHCFLWVAAMVTAAVITNLSIAAATATPQNYHYSPEDLDTCPLESVSNVRLLMETRFDALGAAQLVALLEQSQPSTQRLFRKDLEHLRILRGTPASSSPSALIQAWLAPTHSRHDKEEQEENQSAEAEEDETAVLAEVAGMGEDPHAELFPPRSFDLVDLRRRFVEHFGSLLCRGLFASTTSVY